MFDAFFCATTDFCALLPTLTVIYPSSFHRLHIHHWHQHRRGRLCWSIHECSNQPLQIISDAGLEGCRAAYKVVSTERLPPRIQLRAQTLHGQGGLPLALLLHHLQQHFPHALRLGRKVRY